MKIKESFKVSPKSKEGLLFFAIQECKSQQDLPADPVIIGICRFLVQKNILSHKFYNEVPKVLDFLVQLNTLT